LAKPNPSRAGSRPRRPASADRPAGKLPPADRARRSAGAWTIFLATAIVTAAVDLLTKHLAFRHLLSARAGELTVIPGLLRLKCSTNAGAVFGVQLPSWLILVATAAAVVAVFILFAGSARLARWLHLALGMVMGGALGNAYDRLFSAVKFPHETAARTRVVRDFIDLYLGRYHWPTFNLADVWLVAGVGLILLHAFRRHTREEGQ